MELSVKETQYDQALGNLDNDYEEIYKKYQEGLNNEDVQGYFSNYSYF